MEQGSTNSSSQRTQTIGNIGNLGTYGRSNNSLMIGSNNHEGKGSTKRVVSNYQRNMQQRNMLQRALACTNIILGTK